MPMVWNAEADAKLFAGFIQVHDVKPINLQALADYMGDECTPKAVSHRLANIKKKVATTGSGTRPPSTPGNRRRSNAISTPKTPKSGGKKNANGKRTRADESGEEVSARESSIESEQFKIKDYDDKESGDDADTPAKDRSALRRSVSAKPGRYTESDDEERPEPPAKKVKTEAELYT